MDPKQLRQIIKEELVPIIKTQQTHSEILGNHSKILDNQTKILGRHSKVLGKHSKVLSEHTKVLSEHTKVLSEHTKKFNMQSEQLDSITAELYQVHKLADATLDSVKGRYEKNKREIDEIKDHLSLPKDSYFGE